MHTESAEYFDNYRIELIRGIQVLGKRQILLECFVSAFAHQLGSMSFSFSVQFIMDFFLLCVINDQNICSSPQKNRFYEPA